MKMDQYDQGYAIGTQALARAKQEVQKELNAVNKYGYDGKPSIDYARGLKISLEIMERAQDSARSKF